MDNTNKEVKYWTENSGKAICKELENMKTYIKDSDLKSFEMNYYIDHIDRIKKMTKEVIDLIKEDLTQ